MMERQQKESGRADRPSRTDVAPAVGASMPASTHVPCRTIVDERRASQCSSFLGRGVETGPLAAANQCEGGIQTLEIDPWRVRVGAGDDRLVVTPDGVERLAASILAIGQLVPILVRPLAGAGGRYEIVAGWRRLLACRQAGISVRAEVQRLDDGGAVLAQAAENIARQNLTYIERARLAVRIVDGMGFEASAVDCAFACGKAERSRYLKIGRGIPQDIVTFIGPAHQIGRPRWEKLCDALGAGSCAEVLAKIRASIVETIGEPSLEGSNERFSLVLRLARDAREPIVPPQEIIVDGVAMGLVERVREDVNVRLFGRSGGLAAWVEAHPETVMRHLLAAYRSSGSSTDNV
jgi:ParB family transcriptional regulator, chromosome partitioning protein